MAYKLIEKQEFLSIRFLGRGASKIGHVKTVPGDARRL